MKDNGAYLERKVGGLHEVRVEDQDFSKSSWGYQVIFFSAYLTLNVKLNLLTLKNVPSINLYFVL